MTRRILACILLAVLVCGLIAGCGSKVITAEKAQKIVLKDLGAKASEVEFHMHTAEYNGVVCFGIYATYKGETWAYTIDPSTGEILNKEESDHAH